MARARPFRGWLVEAQRPAILVELGTYHGFSYGVFSETVKRGKLDTRCHAIDTWRGDEHAGFYGDTVFQRFSAYHASRYSSFSRLVRSTFDEAVAQFPDKTIDLLHIDGRHLYSDVRHDFETWQPKLSDRAVVLFHDTAVRERNFGVFQLWKEVADAYPHFEFLHGNGLGVLGFGREQQPAVRELFQTREDPAMTETVRRIYAHLGRAITNHCNLLLAEARFSKELKNRDSEIERLRSVMAATAVKSMSR
jgi:hypothetical protein